jgi:hypothetical protein
LPNYDVKSTVPTPTRNIREGNALGMVTMMLWKEDWLSEEENILSGVKESIHLMGHVMKKRLEEWVVVQSEQFQC